METINLHLSDDTYRKIKEFAISKNMTINKLFEEFSNIALAEYDAEIKFKARVAKASKKRGLEILDKLDRHFQEKSIEEMDLK
jgi:hypothetical protein